MKTVSFITGISIFILINLTVSGQWTRVTYPFSETPIVTEYQDGAGFSFFDVNEDGWDDLTLCTNNGATRYYQNNQGNFELTYSFPNIGVATACVWADIDEDNDNDLIVSRYDLPLQIFKNNGNNEFEVADYLINYGFYQNNRFKGISLADYNRDAYLDIAAANYHLYNPNCIFTNVNGDYFERLEFSDLNAQIKKSFQSAWCDVNNDKYADVFFANDNNVGNEFYVQNENGYFEDQAIESNLVAPAFAMCASFADYDNDEDQDLFISDGQMNQYPLMINNGQGVFTQDFVQPLFFNLEGWGSLWIDADNDGWQDLFICTRGGGIENQDFNNVFLKNENGNFNNVSIPLITDVPLGYYCNATGDFNNDGKADMVLTSEETGQIILLENTVETNNNYIKFRLEGRLSNRNGIGSKYRCYFGNQVRTGYLQCGENYLTQNSQNIIIGIGTATTVDSMIIEWTSGVIDKHYDVERGSFSLFTEAETLPGITHEHDPCSGGVGTVFVSGWATHEWSNGSMNDSTLFNQNPLSVEVGTGFGHTIHLASELNNFNSYQLNSSILPPTCFNSSDGSIYIWATDNSMNIVNELLVDSLSEGSYAVTLNYGEGCQYTDAIELHALSNITLQEIIPHNACPSTADGQVELIVTGGVLPYNEVYSDTLFISSMGAGFHEGVITDGYNCSIQWQVEIVENFFSTAVTPPSCIDSSDGQVEFNFSQSDGSFHSILFDSLWAGNHTYSHITEDGCTLVWSDTLQAQNQFTIDLNIDDYLCLGDSVQFLPIVNANFMEGTWYSTNPEEWIFAGEHNAIFTSPLGCIWDTSFYLNTSSPPTIETTLTLAENENSGIIHVTVEGEHGPYWIHWQNQTSEEWNFPFQNPGIYAFIITDANGCSIEDSVSIITNGIEITNLENHWSFNGSNLFYWGTELGLPLFIYNTEGKLIYSLPFLENQNTIPPLPNGIYLLHTKEHTYRIHLMK